MQNVSIGDNLHGMLNPVFFFLFFFEKNKIRKNIINVSSAELAQSGKASAHHATLKKKTFQINL